MEEFFGWYFWIAVITVVCVASSWVLYVEYGFNVALQNILEEEKWGWINLAQARNYDRWQCDARMYRDDLLLRKVNNESKPIPGQYIPEDLTAMDYQYTNPEYGSVLVRALVRDPLEALLQDAWRAGHYVLINSAYRSASRQQSMYEKFAGAPQNDIHGEHAALPGFSEHQLGTAVDISTYPVATTAGYQWLADNAYRYGFVLSYPSGAQEITQYRYEPWHWRYVGTEIAEHIHKNDMLYNHEQSLFLPSPIEDDTILSYEYEGKDLWVWKYRPQGEGMDALVRGEVVPSYAQEIPVMLEQFDMGEAPKELEGDFLRTWVIQGYEKYEDDEGIDWGITRMASFYDETTIERLLVMYQEHWGYLIISYQTEDAGDRLMQEFIESCRVN